MLCVVCVCVCTHTRGVGTCVCACVCVSARVCCVCVVCVCVQDSLTVSIQFSSKSVGSSTINHSLGTVPLNCKNITHLVWSHPGSGLVIQQWLLSLQCTLLTLFS